jgi:hypothetical protein
LLAEAVLDLLLDGQWHTVNEMVRDLRHEEELIREVLDFYEQFDFIEINKRENKVKIDTMVFEAFHTDQPYAFSRG